MAAESVGMSQKKKDRAATIGMIIFFSILAILTVLPIYLLVLASFKPGNFLLQYGLNLNLDIPHLTLDNYKLLFTGKHDYWTWFGIFPIPLQDKSKHMLLLHFHFLNLPVRY